MAHEEKFIIIKEFVNSNGVKMPIILLDTTDEILEFNGYEDAKKLATLLELNSDSGWKYKVKKI